MATELEKICLGCTLPICDDKDVECHFVQIRREKYAERHRREYVPVEVDGRKAASQRPETVAKRVATMRKNRLDRMQAKLAERRTAKMWDRRLR